MASYEVPETYYECHPSQVMAEDSDWEVIPDSYERPQVTYGVADMDKDEVSA